MKFEFLSEERLKKVIQKKIYPLLFFQTINQVNNDNVSFKNIKSKLNKLSLKKKNNMFKKKSR